MLGALQRGAASAGWTNAGLIKPFDLADPITVLLTRLVKAQGTKPGAIKIALAAAASVRAANSPHIAMFTKIVAEAEAPETPDQLKSDADGALAIDWGSPMIITVVFGDLPSGSDGRDALVVAAVEFFLVKSGALINGAFGLVGAHYLLGRRKKGVPTSWGFTLNGNHATEMGKAMATALDYKANRNIAVVSWSGGSTGSYIGVGEPSPDKRTGYLLQL